jgi:hypothetical protein
MQRKRLKESDWRREEPRILAFCLDIIKPEPNHRLSMEGIFEEYRKWLKTRRQEDTVLSIDGFGRLFPRVYPRRTIVVAGEVKRGLVGYKLEV